MDKTIKSLFDLAETFSKKENESGIEHQAANFVSAVGERAWDLVYNKPEVAKKLLKELAYAMNEDPDMCLEFMIALKDYNPELFEDDEEE